MQGQLKDEKGERQNHDTVTRVEPSFLISSMNDLKLTSSYSYPLIFPGLYFIKLADREVLL